jgi:hypothetical protein
MRLASCTIGKASKARKLAPSDLYLVVKAGERTIATSLSLSSWDFLFPETPELEFDLSNDENSSYTFAVYASRLGKDPLVTFAGPWTGSKITRAVLEDRRIHSRNRSKVKLEHAGIRIDLEAIGEVCWYRLKNLTIPTDAPSRKPFDEDNDIPDLRIRLYLEGVPLKSASGDTWSTVLPEGWEGTFPNDRQNWWPILEGSDARYDVEVQDTDGFNEQVFKVSDLTGESFRVPVSEKVGELVGPERAGRIQFELLQNGAVVGQ